MARRGGKDKDKDKDKDVPSCLYMIGGRGAEGEALSSCEFFDSRSGLIQEWTPLPPMDEGRWAAGATAWGGKIWVFGGNNGGPILNTGTVFDPQTDLWTPIPDMSCRRANLCAMGVGKKIYVCGGFGGEYGNDMPLDSAERFDPALNAWETIPSMSAKRFNAASACIGPLLFIFGGSTDKPDPLNSVTCFDARDNGIDWTSMTPMKERRQGCAATTLNGLPYVCGGHDGASCLDSVEYLTPSGKNWLDGGREGKWESSPTLSMPRYGVMACIALHPDKSPKVFVFGGHTGAERTGSVECLGFDSASWESVPKVATADGKRMDPRSGACLASLDPSFIPHLANKQDASLAGLLGGAGGG